MSEGFIAVGAFDYQPDAAAAKALLESHGITVMLTDVETTSVNWFWAGWTGGIKLIVPVSKATEAKALLHQLRSGQPTSSESSDTQCLACGAHMREADSACPTCGWSFAGERWTDFSN